MKRLFTVSLVVFAALTFLAAPKAHAEGFALYEWGARASGLANGMVGRADDASAVAHNPAGITQLPGTQMMLGATMITPKMTIDGVKGGETTHTRTQRHYFFTPHGYVTHQFNDTVWFGFGAFTRFGLGNQYGTGWAGVNNLEDVNLQTLSLNPSLAFKVTDSLSLAIGIEGMIARMKMHKMSYGAYQEMTGQNELGVGFNAAAHYKFNDQWSAGLAYRSAINHRVSGDSTFYSKIMGMDLSGRLKAHLRLPDMISAGVAYKPLPNLSFEAGTVYTVWSRFRNFNVHFSNPVQNMLGAGDMYVPKNWKDTWLFNLSVEYLPLDWLALRLGYSYETSPINERYADYMVETNGRSRYSCGVGFILDNWTIDLAYTMLRARALDYNSAATTGTGVVPGRSHHGITHTAAITVGYKF